MEYSRGTDGWPGNSHKLDADCDQHRARKPGGSSVGPETQVGYHDGNVAPSTLAIGMRVRVSFTGGDAGRFARVIVIVPAQAPTPKPAQPKLADVSGTVTAISGDRISVQTEKHGVMAFAINGDTVIRYRDNNVGLGDVKVGAPVAVVFVPSDVAPRLATTIIIKVTK